MSELYLVKDGPRTVTLAAERDGKLYAFVPNVSSFVYNKPMSVDFQIDRGMTYEPVSTDTAASIVRAGSVGKIDERTNKFLIDEMRAEARRISPDEILGAKASTGTELTPTQVANAVADLLRRTPLGRWVPYKIYPGHLGRQAVRLASDLRTGRVRAFSGIPLISRVISSADDNQIVEVSRSRKATEGRTPPRKAAAKKTGGNVPVKAARVKPAASTPASTHAKARSR